MPISGFINAPRVPVRCGLLFGHLTRPRSGQTHSRSWRTFGTIDGVALRFFECCGESSGHDSGWRLGPGSDNPFG
jgi:hypothetical protein